MYGIIANVQQHVVISRQFGIRRTEDRQRPQMPERSVTAAVLSPNPKMYDRTGWKPHSYSDYDSGSESQPLMSSDASYTSRRSFG